MKAVTTYLFFNGTCKAAMEFYKQCLGGELYIMPFGEAPGGPKDGPAADRIMHAALKQDSLIVMASDTRPEDPLQAGTNFSICVDCDSREEQSKFFSAMSAGGKVTMPLQDTFWGAHFGMLTDRFGIGWMFNYATPK
jgi:PhnB protein